MPAAVAAPWVVGALTASAVAGVASVGASIYQANKQDKANKSAANQAKENARNAQAQADIETNKANQKKTHAQSILSQQQQAAGGAGSTMLTGASGIDPNSLKLGKQTLLGI